MTVRDGQALEAAALAQRGRRVVERVLGRLRHHFDEDLLAIVDPFRDAGWWALPMVEEEADAVGDSPVYHSLRIFDTEWLRERREIHSFFVQRWTGTSS